MDSENRDQKKFINDFLDRIDKLAKYQSDVKKVQN